MSNTDFLSIILISLGLSADCFAVAVSGSITMKTYTRFQVVRTALSFGLFQALMPVLGWLIGRTVVDLIAGFDHWIAFGLLTVVGARMLWSAFRNNTDECIDITKGFLLIILSIATSIDALAVGLTFAVLEINIVLASATIGSVAFIATAAGFLSGKKVGKSLGKRAEVIGGIVLIGIGIRILLSHLL